MKNSAVKNKLWDEFNENYNELMETAFQSSYVNYLLWSPEHGFSIHTEAGGNHIFPNAHEIKRVEGWGNEFEEGENWYDCLYDSTDFEQDKLREFREWEVSDDEVMEWEKNQLA